MSKPNALRNEPRFKFGVNHRKLEPMLAEADKQRKSARKKARTARVPWDRARRDD